MTRYLRLLGAFGDALAASALQRFTWEAKVRRRRERREADAIGLILLVCMIPIGWAWSVHRSHLDEAHKASLRERGRLSAAVEGAHRAGALTIQGVMALAESCEGTSYHAYAACVAPSGALRREDGRYAWRGPRAPGGAPEDFTFGIRMANEVVAAVTPFETAPPEGSPEAR